MTSAPRAGMNLKSTAWCRRMKRQSEQERARRARQRELFEARMCLQECRRPAQKDSNLCKQWDDALCAQYFARIGERRPG